MKGMNIIMKRISCLLFALVLLSSTACSKIEAKSVDKEHFFLKEAIHLTDEMDDLAESKEYLTLMTSSQSMIQIAEEIGAQNYETPSKIYLLELPKDILNQLSEANGLDKKSLEGMSDSVLEKVRSKVNGNIFALMINSSSSSENLALTSMLTWGKSYQQPKGWSNNTIALLLYDGDYSSMVSFVQSGDEIISASSSFIKNNDLIEELKTTKEEAKLFEQIFGIKGIKYKKYTEKDLKKLEFK
jgi:hypothetical protein